jgi:hypothetical protein
METIIGTITKIIYTLTPIICTLLGIGGGGKIILKIMEYKNDEKIRKEKRLSLINSNLAFYKKLFDLIASNVKLWQMEQRNTNDCDVSIKMTIADFDTILGNSIVNFNNDNGYLDMEDQISLKMPLQAREIY